MDNESLVRQLVWFALDKRLEDIVGLHTEEAITDCIDGERDEIVVFWIGPDVGDQVHCFWRLVKAKKLARKAHVIFTNINGALPCWADLNGYEGGKFGSIYLLVYDADTIVGVKPSQKGVIIDMK